MAFTANEWKPTEPQALFASLPWTIKEAFFGGGVGGGKSDLLLMLPLLLQLHEHPLFKQLFMRRTFREIKLEIVPRSLELYRKFGATFNQSDMAWTFPRPDQFGSGSRNSGAMIFFGHCEHEKDVHNYDGMEINIFSPDELTSFTEYQYIYIARTRVRTSAPELPSITRGAGMPGGVGHGFVKKLFVDPAPKGGVIIKGKAGRKRFYVHSTLLDNPHIDQSYKSSIESLPEAERRAKLGDWDAFQGQVFDEFREFRYPDEPANALHVIEPIEIPIWWPRIVVGDWGFAAMTWVGFAAISPKGRIYIYRELAWTKTKISSWAPVLRTLIEKENVKLVKFCKSAGQDRGQEHTIQQQISSELGREIELTDNSPGSRIAGKMLIHEYLRWRPKPQPPIAELEAYDEEKAMSLLRNRGEKAYKDYTNQYVPQPSEVEFLPRLLISDECPILVEAIKTCSYNQNPSKKEDIAEFEGDDPIDGLRYLVDAADNFVRDSQHMDAAVQREKVLDRLQSSHDFTAFYRQMRTLESGTKLQGIRRYKRH